MSMLEFVILIAYTIKCPCSQERIFLLGESMLIREKSVSYVVRIPAEKSIKTYLMKQRWDIDYATILKGAFEKAKVNASTRGAVISLVFNKAGMSGDVLGKLDKKSWNTLGVRLKRLLGKRLKGCRITSFNWKDSGARIIYRFRISCCKKLCKRRTLYYLK